jgi:hypothetical protein
MTLIDGKKHDLPGSDLLPVRVDLSRKKGSRTHCRVASALINQPGPAYSRRIEHPTPFKSSCVIVAKMPLEEI